MFTSKINNVIKDTENNSNYFLSCESYYVVKMNTPKGIDINLPKLISKIPNSKEFVCCYQTNNFLSFIFWCKTPKKVFDVCSEFVIFSLKNLNITTKCEIFQFHGRDYIMAYLFSCAHEYFQSNFSETLTPRESTKEHSDFEKFGTILLLNSSKLPGFSNYKDRETYTSALFS